MISDSCGDGSVVAFLAKTWALLNVSLARCRIHRTAISSAGTPRAKLLGYSMSTPWSDTSFLRGFDTKKLRVSSGRYMVKSFSSICMALKRSSEHLIPKASLIPISPETIKAPFV